MVGKYTGLSDSYLSVVKALQHACMAARRKLKLQWVASTDLEPAMEQEVRPSPSCNDGAAAGSWNLSCAVD